MMYGGLMKSESPYTHLEPSLHLRPPFNYELSSNSAASPTDENEHDIYENIPSPQPCDPASQNDCDLNIGSSSRRRKVIG